MVANLLNLALKLTYNLTGLYNSVVSVTIIFQLTHCKRLLTSLPSTVSPIIFLENNQNNL